MTSDKRKVKSLAVNCIKPSSVAVVDENCPMFQSEWSEDGWATQDSGDVPVCLQTFQGVLQGDTNNI